MFFGHDWPILGKMGAGTSPAECEVFCVVIHVTFRQLRNGWFSRNLLRCPVEESGKTFSKIFTLGSFAPKIWNRKLVKEAPHSEQATVHGMHCREILFTPRCSPKAREFPRSVNFSLQHTLWSYGASKVAEFSDFSRFSPYKTPKTYLPVTSLQPRVYIAEWLQLFRMMFEGPKGCLQAVQFSCDFW